MDTQKKSPYFSNLYFISSILKEEHLRGKEIIMLKLLLVPFGMNTKNKFFNNFATGITLSVFSILILASLKGIIIDEKSGDFIVLTMRVTSGLIVALNLLSYLMTKMKIETIMEIYDEINMAYFQLYCNCSFNQKNYYVSCIIIICVQIITYRSIRFPLYRLSQKKLYVTDKLVLASYRLFFLYSIVTVNVKVCELSIE